MQNNYLRTIFKKQKHFKKFNYNFIRKPHNLKFSEISYIKTTKNQNLAGS